MKIVVAPDSFKGSISARELCASFKKGVLRVFPHAEVVEMPLADGGEGTLENMVYASEGRLVEVEVKDPLGRPIRAAYGVLGDGRTVVIEMAQASGLPLLTEEEKNPLITTSYGTGELIRHALDAGYRHFIIGLGGSATNDGGTGMLRALGVKFYDKDGLPLPEGGGALSHLDHFDESGMDPRIKEAVFTIASDVTNPLCGPDGASAVFGPQKGATPDMVRILDQGLDRFGEIIFRQKGIDIRNVPGSGAAGGVGAALMAFLRAKMKSGIEVVMEAIGFEKSIRDADLVITGEGKLDAQTLSGKVIAGVSRVARSRNVTVIALCGGIQLEGHQLDELGVAAGFSIVPGPCTLEEAMEKASNWVVDRTEQIMRLLKTGKNATRKWER